LGSYGEEREAEVGYSERKGVEVRGCEDVEKRTVGDGAGKFGRHENRKRCTECGCLRKREEGFTPSLTRTEVNVVNMSFGIS